MLVAAAADHHRCGQRADQHDRAVPAVRTRCHGEPLAPAERRVRHDGRGCQRWHPASVRPDPDHRGDNPAGPDPGRTASRAADLARVRLVPARGRCRRRPPAARGPGRRPAAARGHPGGIASRSAPDAHRTGRQPAAAAQPLAAVGSTVEGAAGVSLPGLERRRPVRGGFARARLPADDVGASGESPEHPLGAGPASSAGSGSPPSTWMSRASASAPRSRIAAMRRRSRFSPGCPISLARRDLGSPDATCRRHGVWRSRLLEDGEDDDVAQVVAGRRVKCAAARYEPELRVGYRAVDRGGRELSTSGTC